MNIKKIYARFLFLITKILGVDFAKEFDSIVRFHKLLNLKNPISLADKVSYIELHEQNKLTAVCTDKIEVRNYVISKGLEYILIPKIAGPWSDVNEIDFSELPEKFVLKATHGCKMNYIVESKTELDINKCRKELQRWMATTYGGYSMEPHYAHIPHRLYAEKFLGSNLMDYKIHCINGEPQFVLVCSERKSDADAPMKVTLDLFDMDWNIIPEVIGSKGEVPGNGLIKKPDNFDEMKKIAITLAQDFKFVRVDLYEKNGNIYFGELTFSPAGCVFPYFTDSFNRKMGEKLVL